MVARARAAIPRIVEGSEEELLSDWVQYQLSKTNVRSDLIPERDLRDQSRRFLELLGIALQSQDGSPDATGPGWGDVREFLGDLSRSRAAKGFSPSETATFVFSLKKALFERLRKELKDDPHELAEETWKASQLLDQLGLYTTEVHQKGREEFIFRQQQEMLELSTPVVRLWEGVLALPLIGRSTARARRSSWRTCSRRSSTRGGIAIIDITGVPTVDTLVAQHLLKTVPPRG
jgi:rsbT co-antagonist protein RsbR